MSIIIPRVILFAFSISSPSFAQGWVAHSIDQEGKGADGVRLADVNGDGLLDIASGWEEAGETRVYLHPGVDQLGAPWPKVVVGQSGPVEDAVFLDLDGDGAVDVVSPLMDKHHKILRIYRGLGKDSTRWEAIDIALPKNMNKGVAIGDVDLDGQLEILVSHEYAEIYVLKHDGKIGPGHWSIERIATGGKFDDLTLYDVDQDGDLDVFATDEQGLQVVWYENPKK